MINCEGGIYLADVMSIGAAEKGNTEALSGWEGRGNSVEAAVAF